MISGEMNKILENRMLENATMLRVLPKRVTERDYPARGSGWLEYRFLSLMERTRRFANDYCDSYYWTFGRRISFDFETTSDEFVTLWKMRHSADIWGVSYPLYLEVAFGLFRNPKFADKLAVPNLIFAKREDTPTWRKRFAKLWEEHIYTEYSRVTRMAEYWLVNDKGLPAQKACRRRLMSFANSERRYQYFAETYSVGNKILPVGDILSAIVDPGERAGVEAAIADNVASSRIFVAAEPALNGHPLQTCFGLPPMLKGFESSCSTCIHQRACAMAAESQARINDLRG